MSVQTQHRFSVEDYYRMAEAGVFKPGTRVELLEGKIIDMSPIGPFHGALVKRLIRIFSKLADGRWTVSAQDPLRLDDHSEPQPDLMLLKPSPDDYAGGHPQSEDVFLLIEVSDTTIGYDRGEKLPAYGRAGISEVWILNLQAKTVEVYREPHFTGYSTTKTLGTGEHVAPFAFPDAVVDVAELLKSAK